MTAAEIDNYFAEEESYSSQSYTLTDDCVINNCLIAGGASIMARLCGRVIIAESVQPRRYAFFKDCGFIYTFRTHQWIAAIDSVRGAMMYGGADMTDDGYYTVADTRGYTLAHVPALVESLDELISLADYDAGERIDESAFRSAYGADVTGSSETRRKLAIKAILVQLFRRKDATLAAVADEIASVMQVRIDTREIELRVIRKQKQYKREKVTA